MGNVKNISGKKINDWFVISENGRSKNGSVLFLCECECGNRRTVEGRSIRSGTSTNCGCKRRQHAAERSRAACTKHGGKSERLYGVWRGMKDRCKNPNSRFYSRYGGRGILVCDEWDSSYAKFREWALENGYDPTLPRGACTLERTDNNLGYSPENCIWATSTVQCNNRSNNHLITFNEETHTLTEWSRMRGIRKDTLRRRLFEYGWSVERALNEPTHKHQSHKT